MSFAPRRSISSAPTALIETGTDMIERARRVAVTIISPPSVVPLSPAAGSDTGVCVCASVAAAAEADEANSASAPKLVLDLQSDFILPLPLS